MYTYDAIHNSIKHVEDAEIDVFDERGILKDGKKVRVPMMMRDSATVDERDRSRAAYDYAKAELGARYKGGLQDGDTFRLGDRMVTVAGRNPENGKVVLRDASTSTADAETARQSAYDLYDHDIQNSWMNSHDAKAGDDCTTAGREQGTWRRREKDGKLVCVPGKSANEWDIAGPLSDAEMVQVKDRMYADYDAELAQRWRR